MYEMLLSLSVSNSVHGKRLRNNRCVRFEAALRRMISDWFESMRIHLFSYGSRDNVMSFCAAPLQVEHTYCLFRGSVCFQLIFVLSRAKD